MSKIQITKNQDEIVSNIYTLMEGKEKLPALTGTTRMLDAGQKNEIKESTLAMMASQYEVTVPQQKAMSDMDIKQSVVMENKSAHKRQTRSHMWGSALRTKRIQAEALNGLDMDSHIEGVGFGNAIMQAFISADKQEAARKFADEVGVLANKDMVFKLNTDDDFIAAVPRLVEIKKQLDTLTRMEKSKPEAMAVLPEEVMSIYKTAKERAVKLVNYYQAKTAVMTDPYYVSHYQSEISYSYNEADSEEVRTLSIKLWALEAARAQLNGEIVVPRVEGGLKDVSRDLTETKRGYANELLGVEFTRNEKVDVPVIDEHTTEAEKKSVDMRALACHVRMQTIAASIPTPPGLCGAQLLNMPLNELAACAGQMAQKNEDIRWILETYQAYRDAGAKVIENVTTASDIDGMKTYMAVYNIIQEKLREFANGTGSYADCKQSMIEEVMKLDNGAQIIENLNAGYRNTMFEAQQSDYKSDAGLIQEKAKWHLDFMSGEQAESGTTMFNRKRGAVIYIEMLEGTHNELYTEQFWKLLAAYKGYFNSHKESDIASAYTKLIDAKNQYLSQLSGVEIAALQELDDKFEDIDSLKNGTMQIPQDAKIENLANPATRFGAIYTNSKDRVLFPEAPTVHDIQQRTVADCYLLATLTGIANADPEKIMSMMKDEGDTVVVGFVMDDERLELHGEDGDSLQDTFTKNKEAGAEAVLYRMISKVLSSDYLEEARLINERFREEDISGLDDFVEIQTPREEIVAQTLTKCLYSNNPDYIKAKIDALFNEREFGLNKPYMIDQIKSIMELDVTDEEKTELVRAQIHSILEALATTISEDEDIETTINSKLRPEIEEDANGHIAQKHIQKMEYVRVTKEIPQFAGMVDAYASAPLWAQIYEKAYAAKFGGAEGYAGIAFKNASEVLRHIYGIGYDNRDALGMGTDKRILKRFDNAAEFNFRDFGRDDRTLHVLEKDYIDRCISKARVAMHAVIPSIEAVMKEMDTVIMNMTKEQRDQFGEFLSAHYGLNYGTMSNKYTEAAMSVFMELSARIGNRETVVVGCNYSKSLSEEELAAAYEHNEKTGIRNEHAYTVLDVIREADGMYVKLRDPYARFVRKYEKATDEDGEEYYKSVADTSHTLARQDDDGIFNMELNDFLRTFNEFSGVMN